jgi:hypothetical protein
VWKAWWKVFDHKERGREKIVQRRLSRLLSRSLSRLWPESKLMNKRLNRLRPLSQLLLCLLPLPTKLFLFTRNSINLGLCPCFGLCICCKMLKMHHTFGGTIAAPLTFAITIWSGNPKLAVVASPCALHNTQAAPIRDTLATNRV